MACHNSDRQYCTYIMSGRGNLLSLFNNNARNMEISNSSEDYEIDSGLDFENSETSGECFLSGHNIETDLITTLQHVNISVGRGRAKLIHTLKKDRPTSEQFITTELINSKENIIENSKKSELEAIALKNGLFFPDIVHGSKGSSVNIYCNYLKLTTDVSKGIFNYEVRFFPPIDSVHLRIKYLNEHKDKLGGTKTFDGTTLYLPILLPNKMTVFVSKVEDAELQIRILFKKKEDMRNCTKLYNILFDRVMKTLNYVKLDRKHFDPLRPKIVPLAKLEVWPGYVTAVDEYKGGLMLCCDVSHRILCRKTVLEMLVDLYQQNIEHYQESARKMLVGNIVLTRYNNRTYKINEICFDQNPKSQFQIKTVCTSYVEYYRQYHNINIKDVNQPLLHSIKKSRTTPAEKENVQFCLIPELCYLTGLRDEVRSDNKLMREIAAFTRVSPNQRQTALNKFYENVSRTPAAKDVLNSWGLGLTNNSNKIAGRQMDIEQICFSKMTVSAGKTAEFSKYAVSNEMLEVVHLSKWIIIHLRNDMRAANNLLDNMKQSCKSLGMNISIPTMISLDHDRIDAYIQALRRNITTNAQIVVCICHNSRDDRYSAIKKICCSEIPIPSQVINATTLLNESKIRSVVQKIVLQMNCKIGGSLWTVKIPFKNVMVCGIDSYHDPSNRGKSVAAFVASINSSYSQWYSKAVLQTDREEMVNGLSASLENALQIYHKRNGKLPDNVIIYRDGIGDGELNTCLNYEIPQFEMVCGNRIKISFVVVQKRVSTRIFSGSGIQLENPLPGTVIDQHITKSKMYDFFLVSQFVRQGTVTPTHYVVLRDDCNYGPDIIQKLSYKLCFLYYNWAGTLRIPACCMYAHKLAYLIGQSIQRDVAGALLEKLFYL
ncbi:protein argonaute-3 isoform X2 [Drosophila yakuba]|uniref:protein argonaute-3 isoform X2 n=1 Tax=Drosophila yakuba TaxID=7245 RepID=UPI00193080AE|nr:protein argonaute-3 isoform X2 [Drosophila yakuba]